MSDVTGQQLLDIANGCWSEKKQDYRGFQYLIAVGQAKRGIERKRGQNKDRTAEAKHQVSVLFTHARQQTPERLGLVAGQAAEVASHPDSFSTVEEFEAAFNANDDDLYSFASEVTNLLNGVHSGGFGIIDPTMIIGLITAIISAIQACKKPLNPPTPTPVPTPTPAP